MAFEADEEGIMRRIPGARKGPLAAKEIIEVKENARRRLEKETEELEARGLVSR